MLRFGCAVVGMALAPEMRLLLDLLGDSDSFCRMSLRRPGDMKILVIEEHSAQLKLAHHLPSAAGHDVSDTEAAERGAFAAIKADRSLLILVDLVLPGMVGLTLVRKLKADPDTRDIHVVAVTSYPGEYPEVAAMAAGCDAYFLKPINARELSSQHTASPRDRTIFKKRRRERLHENRHR
jgi:CheY-like chemotaxis protein